MNSDQMQGPPGGDPELQLGLNVLNIVDVTICALSIVGATGIVISFIVDKHLRKIRHKLILGLAVADIVQTVAVLAPGAYNMVQGRIPTDSRGCASAGFFYLTATWNNSFWTLAIAIVTYIMLVHPLSRARMQLEKYWFHALLWISSWGICLINAGIGIALYPVVDVGGLCFWSQSSGQYGDLILFVPRAVTLGVVTMIYIRLFVFFRRVPISNYTNSAEIKNSEDLPDFQDPTAIPDRRSSHSSWSFAQQFRKHSKDSDHTFDAGEIATPNKSHVRQPANGQSIIIGGDRRGSEPSILSNSQSTLVSSNNAPITVQSIPLSTVSSPLSREARTSVAFEDFRWPSKGHGQPAEPCQTDSEAQYSGQSGSSHLPDEPSVHARHLSAFGTSLPSDMSRSISSRPLLGASTTSFVTKSSSQTQVDPSSRKSPRNWLIKRKRSRRDPRRPMSPAELNKRASMLMLLYPLAYVLLFSASFIRLIIHIVSGQRNTATIFGAISRWLILSTGLVDAIIFLVVESIFRRHTVINDGKTDS